ncbi:hypothetical protein T01_6612, partial [Trichinella spiralis]
LKRRRSLAKEITLASPVTVSPTKLSTVYKSLGKLITG